MSSYFSFSGSNSENHFLRFKGKGIPKPGSDYDFLIVMVEKDRKIVEEVYDIVTDFLINNGVNISLKIYRETVLNSNKA